MRALDLTLLTDLYELTMMQGYFKNPTDQVVVFDAFYRQNPCDGGYAIAAGLEQVIEYIRDLYQTSSSLSVRPYTHSNRKDRYILWKHLCPVLHMCPHYCLPLRHMA